MHRPIQHHVHTGWPDPLTGVLASFVFAVVLAVYAVLLIVRA